MLKKTLLVILLFLSTVLICSSAKSDNCFNNVIKDEQVNIDYERNDIIYDNYSKNEKGDNDSFTIQKSIIEMDELFRNEVFYNVINYSANNSYYVSFGNNVRIEGVNVIGIIVIPKNSNHEYYFDSVSKQKNIMEVIYEVDCNSHISIFSIQDNVFGLIADNSTSIIDISSENSLSTSLLDILNYERRFYLTQLNADSIRINDNELNSMREEQLRSGYCNSSQTVTYQQFDNYTSHKGALNALVNNLDARDSYKYYKHNYGDQYQATDTIIVDVIPKQLFTTAGIYSYIGTTYGFFVKTVYAYSSYTSDFIIFAINQTKKNANTLGKLEIKPVLKGYVDYISSTNVISQIYNGSRLVLTDINCDISLSNKSALNVGDTNYDPYNDYGYHLNGYNISCNVSRTSNGSLSLKNARLLANALGFIPKYGKPIKWTAMGVTYAIEGIYNAVNAVDLHNITLAQDGSNYVGTTSWIPVSTDATNMINYYGALVKGVNANLEDLGVYNEPTIFYDVNGANYFRVEYGTARKDSSVSIDAFVETKIALSIEELNSNGTSMTLQDTVNNSWAEEYNQHRESAIQTISTDEVVEAEFDENGYQKYNFTPYFSGWYDIETFGTNCDTVLALYNGNSLIKGDDNSGRYYDDNEETFCSLMHYNLTANTTYTIRVKEYNWHAGYTYLIVKKYGDSLSRLTTPTGYTTFSGYSEWQTFEPESSGIYDIFSFNYNDYVNTYMELYDRNHNRIMFCDDYDNTLHGKVSFYLEEEEIYFVHTWHSGSSTSQRQFGVAAIKEEEIRSSILSSTDYETYDKIEIGTDDVIIYRFHPSQSDNYSFYTTYGYGTKDLVMYLFDSDFNQLAYNDDGNGNLQPKISYDCYYYKTYYIMIKQYSPANGNWTWFYFNVEEN